MKVQILVILLTPPLVGGSTLSSRSALAQNLPVDGPVDNFLAKRCLNGTLNAYVPDLTVTLGPIGAAAQLCGQVLGPGPFAE